MTEVADPARFSEAMAEQEWRMRVRLSDKLYDWLDQEAERRGTLLALRPQLLGVRNEHRRSGKII